MAENRNQYERIHKINERLNRWRGTRVVTKNELLALTGYSERTLKEDLRYLREAYHAPLQYDYRQKGYRYTAPFDLQVELVLSDRDLRNLYGAVQTLTQFKEMGLFDDLRSTVEKIEKAVHFRAGRLPAQALLFEQVPYFHGSQLIEIFLEAIQKQRAVHFLHQKFENSRPERYLVEPYVVKEHRNRWYLVGLARNRRGIRCFGLDRILPDSVRLVEEEAVESTFDAEAYFRQALGIAVYDQPAEEVVLSMTPTRGRYFKTQPFFHYQNEDILVDDDAEFRVRLHIIVNEELVYELARSAHETRVVAPEPLRHKLREHLRKGTELNT